MEESKDRENRFRGKGTRKQKAETQKLTPMDESTSLHLSFTYRSPRVAPHVAPRVAHLSFTYRSPIVHLSFTYRSPIAHLSFTYRSPRVAPVAHPAPRNHLWWYLCDATYSTLLYPNGARRACDPSGGSSVPGGGRSQRSGGGCPTVLGLTTGGCQVRRDPR